MVQHRRKPKKKRPSDVIIAAVGAVHRRDRNYYATPAGRRSKRLLPVYADLEDVAAGNMHSMLVAGFRWRGTRSSNTLRATSSRQSVSSIIFTPARHKAYNGIHTVNNAG